MRILRGRRGRGCLTKGTCPQAKPPWFPFQLHPAPSSPPFPAFTAFFFFFQLGSTDSQKKSLFWDVGGENICCWRLLCSGVSGHPKRDLEGATRMKGEEQAVPSSPSYDVFR